MVAIRVQSLVLVCLLTIAKVCQSTPTFDARDISADGCLDAESFDTCLEEAEDKQNKCTAASGGNGVASGGCLIGSKLDKIQCYMESCWNKVYTCEYQYLVNSYQTLRGLTVPEEVPFWPAPDNAPGGCSCNLGNIYVNSTGSATEVINCSSRVNILDGDGLTACACCGLSAAIGAYYGFCPTTDPDQVDLSTLLSGMTTYEAKTGTTCGTSLSTTDCEADWGIGSPDEGRYLDPAVSLPPNGTLPLSTTGASLTSAPTETIFTWSIFSAVRTVTMAAYTSPASAGSLPSGGTSALSSVSSTAATRSTATNVSSGPGLAATDTSTSQASTSGSSVARGTFLSTSHFVLMAAGVMLSSIAL